MYRSALCICTIAMLCSPAQASTLAVESITITGASYLTSDNPFAQVLTPGSAATLDDSLLNGVLDADGVHGNAGNPVVTGLFYGLPLYGYFAHSVGTIQDPDPDAITMTLDTDTMAPSADFSGFFAEWNFSALLQGGTATGTAAWLTLPLGGGPATFNFDVHWTHDTTTWNLLGTGMVMMVPEAETWAMMVAGLGLVGATVGRRRRWLVSIAASTPRGAEQGPSVAEMRLTQ